MGGDDDSEFRKALSDVKPLPDRDRVKPPPKVAPKRPPRRKVQRFEIVAEGERHEGWAVGIDAAHLRRLRRGEVPVDRRVDLHGFDAAGAERVVRQALEAAAAEDERCVLIVHGRGRGSPGGPVLKSALPGWLAEPPNAALVMAFASSVPRDGGPGATYVLLRRRRHRRRPRR